ncbi:hypothetical protein N7532_008612 [Penicillium argentinense]|uniref:Retrovirus-related Pol polyprotein from transposon TNT 1-94-like beta-barrel domain-containing protein n=1 Tax=Penicillium argentinense TaxID=1131581 RepID=A0A9W9EXP3_9EURO|nr:uncharacterized protein N7532_008612 [Penicillium argentinense]KAJ5089928.1 hypothetical protein N7532_008612 [Penicillium argentinense]
MAIRDLLQAIQLQDTYFANQWRQRLTEYEERRNSQRATSESSIALVKVDGFAPTFHGVLSDYRDHRQVQNQAPLAGGSGRLAFTATLNGQPPAGRNQQNLQKKICVCGRSGHPWKRCYEINWTLRPTDFKSNKEARKKTEENLKREPPQVQQEIMQMLQSDPSKKGKTAQLAITASDDLPTETIAFFTATISPEVYHAAITYSLKNNWVVDSEANVHICNQKERFLNLRKDLAEITLGNGHSTVQGRGTARIIVRNPQSGKTQWATLTDVWYAPDFATNIISAR